MRNKALLYESQNKTLQFERNKAQILNSHNKIS